jgi:hypothetical protein
MEMLQSMQQSNYQVNLGGKKEFFNLNDVVF